MKNRRTNLLSLGAIFTLIVPSSAPAQWGRTADEYIRIPLNEGVRLCPDGNGGAWAAGDPVGLCHIDREGYLTWGDTSAIHIPPATSYNPHLVPAENGDVILAVDVYYADAPTRVKLHRFNLDQEYVWDEDGIALDTTNRIQSVVGLYNGPIDSTYLVHWVIYDENSNSIDWRLQLIDHNGDLLWGERGVRVNYFYPSSKIVISSNQCIVASHNLPLEDDEDLGIIKLNPAGEQLWTARYIVTNNVNNWGFVEDLESDRAGGVLLSYEYERRETINDSLRKFRGIKVMRISANGDSLWTRQVYERDHVYGDRFTIDLIINYAGSGRFFVAWADHPHSVQVVALDVDGEFLWGEPIDIVINSVSYGRLNAVDSESGVCYTWVDTDHDREIVQQQWGQRISITGERLWGDRGRAIQARTVWYYPSITTDGNGGVITVVEFNPTIQMINRNGEIGVVLPVRVSDHDRMKPSPSSPQLFIYPNPGNSQFRIELKNIIPGQIFRYHIYNLVGRTVRAGTIAGAPYLINDFSKFPSGEYILRLESPRATVSTRFLLAK